MTAKEQKELEENLLTPEQLRELKSFDEKVRYSNCRFNELITTEADLSRDEYYEFKNFSGT